MTRVTATRRLPGFRFEPPPLPPADVLPRMDIAVFVGFAACGPLHRPVPVEDAAEFTNVFGGDLPLAWDPTRASVIHAHLAPAVRAFFRNGGRRCWVTRVAGPSATANQFPVPGLLSKSVDGTWRTAHAQARCVGSWSDGLGVCATLNRRSLDVIGENEMEMHETAHTMLLSPPLAPFHVKLDLAASDVLVVGDLLRFGFPAFDLFVIVTSIQAVDVTSSVEQRESPRGAIEASAHGPKRVRISAESVRWVETDQPLDSPLSPPVWYPVASPAQAPLQCERLTFDLWVRAADGELRRMSELGFAPAHPRYWRALPTDTELFPPLNSLSVFRAHQLGEADPRHNALRDEVRTPRFPIAGDGLIDGIFVPDMATMPTHLKDVDQVFSVEQQSSLPSSLERDGLSDFSAALFLDSRLIETGTHALVSEADFLRYQTEPPADLRGIHTALDVDEATLIAAPDVVHVGWQRADQPALLDAVVLPPLQRPEWWHYLPCDPPPKIEGVDESNRGEFLACGVDDMPQPPIWINNPQTDTDGSFTLIWGWGGDGSISPPATPDALVIFTLEEATRPDFGGATVLYQGRETHWTVYGRAPGDYYYRVRTVVGEAVSDWSIGIGVRVALALEWRVMPAQDYDDAALQAVHRALLRLCAARGDLFAVLTLPEHYREDEAIRHAQQLRAPNERAIAVRICEAPSAHAEPDLIFIPPLGVGEVTAFSFGAVYLPWLIGRDTPDAPFRSMPSDGALCGVMARRALTRGAWVAPANEPLQGVVALTPTIRRERWQALQDVQLNVIRQEPRGFVVLNADTLSVGDRGDNTDGDSSDLRPINVRRLLSLLRRLALREGATFVFEPDNDDFRRRVQRSFENVLARLFARGAFAGSVAARAFQVVTGQAINTPQSLDLGRFIVELRVAPSVPMRFITVRLIRSNDRAVVEETT